MGLNIEEQEVTINLLRTDDMAEIYCSDSTWITKLENKCKSSPDLYTCIKRTEYGNTYTFPKKLISLRNSITTRELTEEQKLQAAERFKKMWEEKKKQS